MTRQKRSDLVFGILLLLIGAWFLGAQFNILPGLNEIINIEYQWPLVVIGVGGLLFLLGLLARSPGLSVPACVVAGIGGILYWQNLTGQWDSWSYLWTLIPGFVGVGIILSTLLGGETRRGYTSGLRTILVSAILFVIFLMLFSGQVLFVRYWPVLVILLGIWIIIQGVFRKRPTGGSS
jgi:hypothetical protein